MKTKSVTPYKKKSKKMFNRLLFLVVLLLLNNFALQNDFDELYELIINYFAENQVSFYQISILISVAMVMTPYFIPFKGLSQYIYAAAKLYFEICQLLLFYIGAFNLLFWIYIDYNLIAGIGYSVIFIFFLMLGSACLTLRLIDFNYLVKNELLPSIIFPIISIFIVEIFS
jgi:hypothetical protein